MTERQPEFVSVTLDELTHGVIRAAREYVDEAEPRSGGDASPATMRFNKLRAALLAYEDGPRVPQHHCPECGCHGEADRAERFDCANIECGNYHGGCEDDVNAVRCPDCHPELADAIDCGCR